MLPSDSRTKPVFPSQTGKRLHWVVAFTADCNGAGLAERFKKKKKFEGTVASERLRAAVTEAKRDSDLGCRDQR